MNGLIIALLLISYLLILKKMCISSGRINVDLYFGFLAGFFYYIIFPTCIFYFYPIFTQDRLIYHYIFSDENIFNVVIFSLIVLYSFCFGVFVSKRIKIVFPRYRFEINKINLFISIIVVFLFLNFILQVFLAREALFVGYEENILSNDGIWSARAKLSSGYGILSLIFLAYFYSFSGGLKRNLYIFIFFYSIYSLVLLSMGARLYVMMSIISIISLYSYINKGFRIAKLIWIMIAIFLFMGFIGVWRSGGLFEFGAIFENFALEPILTSLSLYTLVENNSPIWVGRIDIFFSLFKALLPSFVYTEKNQLFELIHDYGYYFEAPVGGYHLIMSLMTNFGILGSVIFIFLLGFILVLMERMSSLGGSYYLIISSYLVGVLCFSLFRDPLFIGLVKNVIFTGFIISFLLMLVSRIKCK